MMIQPFHAVRFQGSDNSRASSGCKAIQLASMDEKTILQMLIDERPNADDGKLAYPQSTFATKQLFDAYIPVVDTQPLVRMFKYINAREDASEGAEIILELMRQRYILPDEVTGRRRAGEVVFRVHPLIAALANLSWFDLGSAGYKGNLPEEARKLFPVTLALIGSPDRERAFRLLERAYSGKAGEIVLALEEAIKRRTPYRSYAVTS